MSRSFLVQFETPIVTETPVFVVVNKTKFAF
ncbi:MAG: hypothetical protein FD133_644 [Erysipelotrichaceae bacterium]|nr:MAG: hypothetical protein FD179_1262 [Erysipelotrichaceae bacterium]TXT18890.1 MAG: hypothetical protein FD133_644 [Erysipelotrichaceae bacterium]